MARRGRGACLIAAQLVMFASAVPTNPFCAHDTMRNTVTSQLSCVNGVIDSIYALFGTPSGECPSFTKGACDLPTFQAYASATCLGKKECTLYSSGMPDPCSEVVKSIAAVAHCSLPPGGSSPVQPSPSASPQPGPPSPTCALSGVCPPPTWAPSWNLTQSSVIQPSSASWFEPAHPWGLISLDWSVNRATWFMGNTTNTTCEATSIENCRRLKAAGQAHRCFIYHNMELALEWLESQRLVMLDPSKVEFFLQYNFTPTPPYGNGVIYNEARAEGSQFFWNYLNPQAASYFISSVTTSLENEATDGTFTDDVDGLPAEHPHAQAKINMSDTELSALRFATQSTSQTLINTLIAAGKYNWQAFGSRDTSSPAPAPPPGRASLASRAVAFKSGPSPSTCASYMATFCSPSYQERPLLMRMNNDPKVANQTVAAFLIVRPPHAYLGWSWESDDRDWNDIFLLQVGEPQGLCSETAPGVFARVWSEGTASLDCNTWSAELPFAALAHP